MPLHPQLSFSPLLTKSLEAIIFLSKTFYKFMEVGAFPSTNTGRAENGLKSSPEEDFGCWWTRSLPWAGHVPLQLRKPKLSWAASTAGCSVASKTRDNVLPLCSTLLGPCLERCIQFWGPQDRKGLDLLGWVQRRLQRWSEGWNTSLVKIGWDCWGCSA